MQRRLTTLWGRCAVGALLPLTTTTLASCGGSSPTTAPVGSKAVSYAGITIDVPVSWAVVQRSRNPCGITGPGVMIGPRSTVVYHCPAIFVNGPVVTLGVGTQMPLGPERRGGLHGLAALVSSTGGGIQGSNTIYQLLARFPDRNAWFHAEAVGLTPQDALSAAERVLTTVHAS